MQVLGEVEVEAVVEALVVVVEVGWQTPARQLPETPREEHGELSGRVGPRKHID